MGQAIQVCGSIFILAGFVLSQWGVWNSKSLGYLIANITGSGILAIQATLLGQWGFLLLEGSWTLISMYSMFQKYYVDRKNKVAGGDQVVSTARG